MVYGIDFFETVVGLEFHDADLGAHGIGDVVEAIGAADEAVRKVEAFGGGDVTALVLQGAIGEAAATGEGFEIMLLIDENISASTLQCGHCLSYKTSCKHQVSCKSTRRSGLKYLSQSDHSSK